MPSRHRVITAAYGETIERKVNIRKLEMTGDDVVLFVVRDHEGRVLLWQKYLTGEDYEDTGRYFILTIEHTTAELRLPPSEYDWGMSVYRNPVYNSFGMPVDGDVIIPVAKGKLEIKKAISREEGLSINNAGYP
jgi:hypothetical protein